MAAVAPFDEQETATLNRLPFFAFFLVAGADGKVDEKEFESFVNGLVDASAADGCVIEEGSPVCRLLANSSRYFESLHPEAKAVIAQGGSEEALDRIGEGAALVDAKLDAKAATAYKECLFRLGRAVAESSGGVLGVGSISKVERNALVSLGGVLGVSA